MLFTEQSVPGEDVWEHVLVVYVVVYMYILYRPVQVVHYADSCLLTQTMGEECIYAGEVSANSVTIVGM